MRIPAFFRHFTALLVILCLLSLTVPASAAAGGWKKKGEKEFKEGMKAEYAQEWDRAVEQFALAIVANPKNTEYRLHFQRATFNASQMYVQRGNAQFEQKDYVGAYNHFRKAYAYDPTNQLAKAEMERMMRLQQELEDSKGQPRTQPGGVNMLQTNYRPDDVIPGFVSQRLEKIGNYKYAEGTNLKEAIKQLAEELDLNVLFDKGGGGGGGPSIWNTRTFGINLKDVSAARALDYIFRQENLFFQKVGPKTIIIADQTRRPAFTELVLRTFYLANANPEDVSKIVQQAIPVQQGRTQTFVQIDKSTNSLTIRDTEENIRIMEKLIKSLDKDRAEVVMDVNIYEVNKRDLLQLGNQIGTAGSLQNLGGFTGGVTTLNRAGVDAAIALIGDGLTNTAMGPFLSIPGSTLSAFQSKSNTKLIASTQVHAFNNEESMARIGQRVPVKSAQYFTGNNNNTGGNGVVGDVFNYEQVGLTLKFTPIVFPNQDVQVKMSIESKDVAGEQTDTPTFSERSITGTARVQNNKTMLLASVAQGLEDKSRQGLPILGLIPVLGRFFSTPSNTNRTVDIVIAVTPRVLRAPVILPEDEEMRATGSQISPTTGSLEAMVVQEERDEFLANARRNNNLAKNDAKKVVVVQVPEATEMPGYVPSNRTAAATDATDAAATAATDTVAENAGSVAAPAVALKPIGTSVRTLDIGDAMNVGGNGVDVTKASFVERALDTKAADTNPQADFAFGGLLAPMRRGDRVLVPVLFKSGTPFRQTTLGIKYDEQKLKVLSVTYGEIFGADQAGSPAAPYFNKGGRTLISLNSVATVSQSGILALVEIEALADGKPQLAFDNDAMNMLSATGVGFALNFK